MTTVLLVEDDPAISEPLARAFGREGYEVRAHGTGKGALEEVSGADIIVLDLGLPDIDGLDVARQVRAQVRRASGEVTEDELTSGEVRVDVAAHRAFIGSRELQLTTREFELLRVLVRGGGQAVPEDVILKEVWGEDPTGSHQTVEMHVTWLRRKRGDDADAPALLVAERDGYRLVG